MANLSYVISNTYLCIGATCVASSAGQLTARLHVIAEGLVWTLRATLKLRSKSTHRRCASVQHVPADSETVSRAATHSRQRVTCRPNRTAVQAILTAHALHHTRQLSLLPFVGQETSSSLRATG